MIRAVLFDLDDTLVDFRPMSPRALFEAGAGRVYAYLTARGCSLPAFDPFLRRLRAIARRIEWRTWLTGGEPDERRLLSRVCHDYGLQRDEISLSRLGRLWYEPVIDSVEPLSRDVISTLHALRDGNVKLALVVNTRHHGPAIDRHLAALGLLDFFPVRAYSSEHGTRKPHAHLYEWALARLGVGASQALFVGDDARTDLLGARRCGLRTCLRTRTPQRCRAQADYAIERIAELLAIFDIVPETRDRAETTPLPQLGVPA
jgi:HAD superfamily hydrolase (TIGR01509 family)